MLSSRNSCSEACSGSAGDVGTGDVVDLEASVLGAKEWTDEIRSDTIVVALHQRCGVSPWTDKGDLLDGLLEREGAVVLDQNDTLDSSGVGELLSRLGVDVLPAQLSVRLPRRRVKVSEATKENAIRGVYENSRGRNIPNKGCILAGQSLPERGVRDQRLVVRRWEVDAVCRTAICA